MDQKGLDKLIEKYNKAVKDKSPEHHRLCRQLAETRYWVNRLVGNHQRNWWESLKNIISNFLNSNLLQGLQKRRGFEMLNEKMVNALSKENKQQLDNLIEEYEAASKELGGKRLFPREETSNRHHRATKQLAEFITLHRLNQR